MTDASPEAPPPRRAAFADAFQRYRTPLVCYAAGFVDAEAAHDLVQDVFVDLWGMDDLGSRPLRPLLYAMTRNRALNHVRDRRTRAATHDEIRLDAATAAEPVDRLDAVALADRLAGWIRALPPRQREALTLTRFHDLSHRDAAHAMGLSARTVNNHVVRALATLKDRLDTLDPAPR